MQLLIDFLPLIAFFASFKLGGIYVATAVLIAATAVQIGVHWVRTHTVRTLHWVSALLVLVLGSATLLLRDAHFIQWKPTALVWIAGVAFLVSHFVGTKPLSRRFLESVLAEHLAPVSDQTWKRINLAWVAFLGTTGALNLYVAHTFSMATWVNFKVFGISILLLLFVVPQVLWLTIKDAPAAGNASLDKSRRDA
jgi:intracellular septation protein